MPRPRPWAFRPHYGQEILACVVLKAGVRCLRGSASSPLRPGELGPYKTPKILCLVDDLPKGAQEKCSV